MPGPSPVVPGALSWVTEGVMGATGECPQPLGNSNQTLLEFGAKSHWDSASSSVK